MSYVDHVNEVLALNCIKQTLSERVVVESANGVDASAAKRQPGPWQMAPPCASCAATCAAKPAPCPAATT